MNISDSVKLALLNIMKEGITDVEVFTRPFELDYLKDKSTFDFIRQLAVERITKAIYIIKNGKSPFKALKELKLHNCKSILVPKKSLFDFRKCGYIDPVDEVIYLALCIMISNKIETSRIHKKSNIVYSYRLKPNLINMNKPFYLFDLNSNYTKFRNDTLKKAKNKNIRVIINCDIGNFYDRLNLHRLENTLLAVKDIDISVVKLLNELLLYWSNRDSYGLPVGSNGSRILAEASLIDVDKYLLKKKIDFARYVDDYRLFAKDAKQAHIWLSILVERLNREGLFLNTSKTSIIESNKVIRTTHIREQEKDEDQEMKKNDLPQIIRGYSGLIPTKFRKLSNREIENLRKENIESIKEKIDIDLIDPKDLLRFLRIIVANEKWKELAEASTILKRFPQFIPYYLDCIIKNKEKLIDFKDDIIPNCIEISNDENTLEYLRIYIVRFLSSEGFISKDTVVNNYHQLKRSEGVYLGRAVLECLNDIIERDDLLEIKNGFHRADPFEKRQILNLLKNNFNSNEFSAFYKNISLNEEDPWYEIISKQ
ncbi:RNA-directed DNA polymerase [Alkalispirochaeta alkalica]|uniref:RNA-directed DNA polymerase n=1 Tax=Alkalispirochaeta alkalica TaxID=46356 RepID=UPI0003A97C26|nr:RNA-directed DNA polymerase [Alkalispirochaeta alkalica]